MQQVVTRVNGVLSPNRAEPNDPYRAPLVGHPKRQKATPEDGLMAY